MCAAATQNFTGIMIVRVLLGFAESPFFPGALYDPQIFLLLMNLLTTVQSLGELLVQTTGDRTARCGDVLW